MSTITSPSSRAELRQLIRDRLSEGHLFLWSTVTDQIQELNRTRKRRAAASEEDVTADFRTVSQMDLEKACTQGIITDEIEVQHPRPGWKVTIEGPDLLGESLFVIIYVPKSPSGAIIVTGFVLPQP